MSDRTSTVFSASKLRGEWEQRVKVIGSLEESLAQVQETFSQRETALIRDRDEAMQRTRYQCYCTYHSL